MRSARCLSLLLLLLLLSGCNPVNLVCGSARPRPTLSTITPSTIAYAQMPGAFQMVLTGGNFVASSVVLFNGNTIATTVNTSAQITVTITTSMIAGPGSYSVQVQTPGGNSGTIGCSSGGESATLTFTVT